MDIDYLLFGKRSVDARVPHAIQKASMLSSDREGVGGRIGPAAEIDIERSDRNSAQEKNFSEIPVEKNFSENSSEEVLKILPLEENEENLPQKIPVKILEKISVKNLTSSSLDEIIPNWREQILTLASDGLSENEIRVALCTINGIFSPKHWSLIQNRDVVVQDTFDQARAIAETWWVAQARRSLRHDNDERFETPLWIFCMKNFFGWGEAKPENARPTPGSSIMEQARIKYMQTETTQKTTTKKIKTKALATSGPQ